MDEANVYYINWTIRDRQTKKEVAFGEAYAIDTGMTAHFDSFGDWTDLQVTGNGVLLGYEVASEWAKGTPYDDPDDDFNLETVFSSGKLTDITPADLWKRVDKIFEQETLGGKIILALFKYSI